MEGEIREIMAWKTSHFLTVQHFYYKSYTCNLITKGPLLRTWMLQAFVLVLVLTSSPHADFQRAVGDVWWCSVLESRKNLLL